MSASISTATSPNQRSPSLIQEDIEANLEPSPGGGQGTFSFDVRNGACGLLTAIELIDGLLASGAIEVGMAVAPTPTPSQD